MLLVVLLLTFAWAAGGRVILLAGVTAEAVQFDGMDCWAPNWQLISAIYHCSRKSGGKTHTFQHTALN